MARYRPSDYLPREVLERPDFISACERRDLGDILAIAIKWGGPGFSYSHVGRCCKMGITQIHDYIDHKREPLKIEIFERVTDGLRIPGEMIGLTRREWETDKDAAGGDDANKNPLDEFGMAVTPLRPIGSHEPRNPFPASLTVDAADTVADIAGVIEQRKEFQRGSHPLAHIDQGTSEDVIDVLGRVQRRHRSTVDPDVMSHLQDSIRDTLVDYESLDHSSLLPALLKQRAWIEALFDECAHTAQRRQLFEIAGATSGVLGYIAVGRGDFRLARAYCLEAFQLGDFAGDANLQAWARGLQSFCEYYAGRDHEALELAKDGISYAHSGPQSVRLTINGTARALGKLGDTEGVNRAVDEAHELMSRNDMPGGVPSSISLECYSAAQTASNAATAYVSLAMPEKVQHYVDLAMPEISKSESPWSRSLVMIDLALSLVRARDADLDRATMLVLDALAISAGRPIISVLSRALEVANAIIGRWGNVPQAKAILDATSSYKAPRARGE